jgi:hypothetical protein
LPYIPFDTGWTHSIYGFCIAAWFIVSRRLLTPKYFFSLFYNFIYGPLMSVLFKSIGLIMTTIGISIISAESVIFDRFDYISPIYNTLNLIGSILPSIQSSPRLMYPKSKSNMNKSAPMQIFCPQATTVQEDYHFPRPRLLLLQSYSIDNTILSIKSSCIESCFQRRSMFLSISIKSSSIESCSQHHSMFSISIYI